jgi:hypothetical protein
MPLSYERDQEFDFIITPIPFQRGVAFAVIAMLLLIPAALVPLLVRNWTDSCLWLLIVLLVIFVTGMASFLPLAFPPKRMQARLQIRHDSVSFVPGTMARRIFSEPVIEAAVTPQSSEILLCHDFFQELSDGYKVIVRSVDGREGAVSVRFLRLPDVEECREISEGITATTGLPVRLVIRRRLVDGNVQEMPWIPKPRSARSYVAVLVMLTPFVGGIAVGCFMPSPSVIVGAGLLLWIGEMLLIRVCGNQSGTQTKFPTLYALSTIFTFGASYAFAYVVAAYMFRAH